MHEGLHRDIISCLPHLRAFARLLARDRVLADDLVQEAVVRVLAHADQFQPGTDFKAWVSKILRNTYLNEMRRRGRASQLSAESLWQMPSTSGEQEGRLGIRDFTRAFRALPPIQRQALALVAAAGYSYEDAAHRVGCAVGTMKSRVSRARVQLQQMVDGERPAKPWSQ